MKVVIRVRPPLRPQDPGFDLIPQRFQRSMVTVTTPTSIAIDSPQGRKLFVFDRVFTEDTTQEGVWEYLTDSVNAFVQGYNVSMMAYGQSGAGKSYTMGTAGPGDETEMHVMGPSTGVIPRAAAALFEKLDGKPAANRDSLSGLRAPKRYSVQPNPATGKQLEKNWTLKATYVEIYNEQLRDLLVPEHIPVSERGQVTIREDTKGHILLTGLHSVEINSVDDLLAALNFGSNIRQTDSTAINAKSSRSHAVFSLNLVQRKASSQTTPKAEKRFSVPLEAMTGSDTMVTIDSKFHFVDLAGSERLKNTGAQGDRAKEGISINAGLASLGKVISQLSSRQAGSHVSYRDSKLTRMLQDSLGGNAITYMIACVTPAEFHLSETLNTVQYAQRARAIQSKPRIQQISDESDKQALIDRLKAEVAFLRDQIRSSERSDRPATNGTTNERSARQNEAQIELQNQLLDSQESYTALSKRHAKLISEMTKARDNEQTENQLKETVDGDNAAERIKRSNKFAEAVEQVVLEYEETIRSLEASLSSTRATLSNTETQLLERETKLAYVETVNTQLQVRVQKLMDREASTENYLQDLEIKLDNHTNGDEKNSAIVNELRKEISRIRENEASCEDYITTLEERLAEADADQEAMKREIERLEHVVERQRSLGQLDKLLVELDGVRSGEEAHEAEKERAEQSSKVPHSRNDSYADLRARGDVIHEGDEVSVYSQTSAQTSDRKDPRNGVPSLSPDSSVRSEKDGPVDNGEPIDDEPTPVATYKVEDPMQVKVVSEKLDIVSQELVELKIEHESTVNEYENLAHKYEEALRAIAELKESQEAQGANRAYNRDSFVSVSSPTTTRPLSFLADARVNELRDNGGHSSSSRSLSSELSLAGESPSLMQSSDAETAIDRKASVSESVSREVQTPEQDEQLAAEVEELRRLAEEKERAQAELAIKYAQLEEKHAQALDFVEELKSEVQKAKLQESSSPRNSLPVIRRKSSQGVMIIDRAHRSFASLRNIASEHFEGQPDVMQNFELNINAAMHELHTRSERVQQLEADIAATRKEMETKMTIISGLTRERSSIKQQSPMDLSAMSAMRDQLLQSENQIRILQETHKAREEELGAEITKLRAAMDAHLKEVQSVGEQQVAEHADSKKIQDTKIAELEAELATKAAQDTKIATLEEELASWEARHQTALASMQASEKQLQATISELESRIAAVKAERDAEQSVATVPEQSDRAVSEIESEQNTAKHETLIASLQLEIAGHKDLVAKNAAQTAELEKAHKITIEQLEEALNGLVNENAAKVAELREKQQETDKALETARHEVTASVAKIAELEESQALLTSQLGESSKAKEVIAAELEENKSYISRLEEQVQELEETAAAHAITVKELESQKALVGRLEQEVAEQQEIVKAHEAGLALLRTNHAKEIETINGINEAMKADLAEKHRAAFVDLSTQHQNRLDAAYRELAEARNELAHVVSQLGEDVTVLNMPERIKELTEVREALDAERVKGSQLEKDLVDLSTMNDSVTKELATVKAELAELLAMTGASDKLKSEQAGLNEQLAVLKKEMTDLETKNKKNSRLVEELEDQLATNFDEHQAATNRLSTLQSERNSQVDMANAAKIKAEKELDAIREEYASLQSKLEELTLITNAAGARRSASPINAGVRINTKTASVQSLPSPPPSMPLPPIPAGIATPPMTNGVSSPIPTIRESIQSNHVRDGSQAGMASMRDSRSPMGSRDIRDSVQSTASYAIAQVQAQVEDQEAKIRTIEKHLSAEKQLTATLEEALTDLERQSKLLKTDAEAWKRRAGELEAAKRLEEEEKRRAIDQSRRLEQQLTEVKAKEIERARTDSIREEESKTRWSLQRGEDERRKRDAQAKLEERMGKVKSKKKGSLNCF